MPVVARTGASMRAVSRTFVMCKPDAVERGLVGEIIRRIEQKGLSLAAVELRSVDTALAEAHYAEHADKPFFGELVAFLTRSPVVAMAVDGPGDDTWQIARLLIGATKVTEALPGTIRGDLATTTNENLVHGSDSDESARRELELWFPGLPTA